MRISRAKVLSNAQTLWAKETVPYDQGATLNGWRTDCSGFVSMCWDLPHEVAPGGADTEQFVTKKLVKEIPKEKLRPGDVVGHLGEGTTGDGHDGHIVLFERWANAEMTSYVGWEQTGPGGNKGPHNREMPYPYRPGIKDRDEYRAYRYRYIEEEEDRMYLQQLAPGRSAVTILLFPFDADDNPSFSIGIDTQPGANPPVTKAQWRIAIHHADKGWEVLPPLVTDSQDGRRHDFPGLKGVDRVSIQRIPIDGNDQCQVPAAALAWW
jgi:hypothetical protein